jgi:pimeloyl-ACP methyl ester carboxylesterase
MMRRALKWIALAIVLVPVLLIAVSFINHRLRLPQEEAAYPAPGQLVLVGDHNLHVYAEGSGDVTLVFLAGSGTSAPVLDFRALYSRLSGDYRIAVVERAGYGWSDIASTPRDIDTVLEETRTALQGAGEGPPYVLFPHSMAGLEALYWAALYPAEVTAIIGLDPAVPLTYEVMPDPPQATLTMITFMSRTGLTRLLPFICLESPAISEGHLTAADAETYCALMYRRTLTVNMMAEIEAVQTNAAVVSAHDTPDVPLYVFISNGDDLPVDSWGALLATFAEEANGNYLVLDVNHYIHNFAPDLIAEESRLFISGVMGED